MSKQTTEKIDYTNKEIDSMNKKWIEDDDSTFYWNEDFKLGDNIWIRSEQKVDDLPDCNGNCCFLVEHYGPYDLNEANGLSLDMQSSFPSFDQNVFYTLVRKSDGSIDMKKF